MVISSCIRGTANGIILFFLKKIRDTKGTFHAKMGAYQNKCPTLHVRLLFNGMHCDALKKAFLGCKIGKRLGEIYMSLGRKRVIIPNFLNVCSKNRYLY